MKLSIPPPSKLHEIVISLKDKATYEVRTRGVAHDSTQVKLNVALMLTNVEKEDFKAAQANAEAAFTFLDRSMDSALGLVDPMLRSKALKGAHEQLINTLLAYAYLNVNEHPTISSQSLQKLYRQLAQRANHKVLNKKKDGVLWSVLLLSLAVGAKRGRLDVIDGVEFIDDTYDAHSTQDDIFSDTDLKWLKIYVVRGFIKRQRSMFGTDLGLAESIARYRKLSSQLLRELGMLEDSYKDLCDAYSYEVLASSSMREWRIRSKILFDYLEELFSKGVISNKNRSFYYAATYLKAFRLVNDVTLQHEYLSKMLRHSNAGKLGFSVYYRPTFYLLDLLLLIKNGTISDARKAIQLTHKDKIIKDFKFQDDTRDAVIDLYESILFLIFNDESSVIPDVSMSHLKLLHGSITFSDKELSALIYRVAMTRLPFLRMKDEGLSFLSSVTSAEEERLEKLLASDEGGGIEVKLSFDQDTIAKAICGFANSNGGKIIVGLLEKGYFSKQFPEGDIADFKILARDFVIVGIKSDVLDRSRQKLSTKIKDKTNWQGSSLMELYNISLVKVGKNSIVLIDVKPYANLYKTILVYEGKPYQRYDNQTVEMTQLQLIQRMSSMTNNVKI